MLKMCILGKQSWSLCVMDVGDSPLNEENKEDTRYKYKNKQLLVPYSWVTVYLAQRCKKQQAWQACVCYVFSQTDF